MHLNRLKALGDIALLFDEVTQLISHDGPPYAGTAPAKAPQTFPLAFCDGRLAGSAAIAVMRAALRPSGGLPYTHTTLSEFIVYTTSMTTYSDPLRGSGGSQGLEISHALPVGVSTPGVRTTRLLTLLDLYRT